MSRPAWRTFLLVFVVCVIGEAMAFGIMLLVVERNLIHGASHEGVPSWLIYGFLGAVLFTAILLAGMLAAGRGIPPAEEEGE